MANTVITYPAQKLKIKSMRASHFKLVINVKDSGGSNYDFTSDSTDTTAGDDVYIEIYRTSSGDAVYNSPGDGQVTEGATALHSQMTNSSEDGKLTIEWGETSPNIYAPWPGIYKYHIYTEDANNKRYVWLYGDFVVEDENIYNPSTSGAI